MSSHEDDDRDDAEEQEIHVDVDSDSRLSCGTGSDVDMDGGSCYDEVEAPLRYVLRGLSYRPHFFFVIVNKCIAYRRNINVDYLCISTL